MFSTSLVLTANRLAPGDRLQLWQAGIVDAPILTGSVTGQQLRILDQPVLGTNYDGRGATQD